MSKRFRLDFDSDNEEAEGEVVDNPPSISNPEHFSSREDSINLGANVTANEDNEVTISELVV